jgi:hypothetical protein
MADPNGWPDASRPGVPLNPERDGWHWLDRDACSREWSAADQCWYDFSGDPVRPDEYASIGYLGPCHTPAEVAAMLAEARAAGVREGMERAVGIAGRVGRPVGAGDGCTYVPGSSADAAAAIRAALREEGA